MFQVFVKLDQPLMAIDTYENGLEEFKGDVHILLHMARIHEVGNADRLLSFVRAPLGPFYTSYRNVLQYIIKLDTQYNQSLPETSRPLQVPCIRFYYVPRYTSVRSIKRPLVVAELVLILVLIAFLADLVQVRVFIFDSATLL